MADNKSFVNKWQKVTQNGENTRTVHSITKPISLRNPIYHSMRKTHQIKNIGHFRDTLTKEKDIFLP
ncbi:MAG: hypothetical protein ACUVUR_00345 [bacterium]